MQNLLNGNYFDKLLDGLHRELYDEYEIEKIDIKVIRNVRKGLNNNLLQDLIDLGVYDERELADSIIRLHKHGIIEMIRTKDVHDVAYKLTRRGNELWERVKKEYDYINEVLFRGMTEEQVETYKRLSQMIIDNINKEANKGVK